MTEKVTTDTILDWFRKQVEDKTPIAPSMWLDGCQKLVSLMSDETDDLFHKQQRVRQMQVDLLKDPKMTVAKAKLITEASDEHREMKRQEAKINAIEEFIRIAKIQSRLRDSEFRAQSLI